MTIRSVLQRLAHLAGDAFRILPTKKRFAAARRIALLIAPLLARSAYFPGRPSLLDGPREEALRIVMRTMTRAKVEFIPEIEVRGYELLADRPVLIVSGHFLLNIAMSRLIMDSGRSYYATLAGPREPMYYLGTFVPLDFIYAGPHLFFQLRRTLAKGHVGFLTAEVVDEPLEHWIEVDTVAGRRYVSPAVFTFAARTRTPLVFGATYLSPEGRLTITFEEPRAMEAGALTAEFCEFLRRHAAAVVR